MHILGPELIFVTGLVKCVTAVARLVCLDLLGQCLSCFASNNFGPSREGISLASDVRSESPARDARVEARLHEHRVVLDLRSRAANTAY